MLCKNLAGRVSLTSTSNSRQAALNRLVLATRNRHKLRELRAILTAAGVSLDLVSLDGFMYSPGPETGLSCAENALAKASAAAQAIGLPAVADDSGLCVDALGGMPGVFSARWAGQHGDDEANVRLLLAQLADVPDEHRNAHFTCAAAVALPDGTSRVVEGRLDGMLTRAPRGANGFGYDPIFQPLGKVHTTAEMSPAEKNAISHRDNAFRALAPALAQLLPFPNKVKGPLNQ